MHTFQIRVSDEIIKLSIDNDFISSMNESKKDIEKGNVSSFSFDEFERKID